MRGFSLEEIAELLTGERGSQQQLIDRKLAELAEHRQRLDTARAALEHGRRCPAGGPTTCPRFRSTVEARQRGLTPAESHARAH